MMMICKIMSLRTQTNKNILCYVVLGCLTLKTQDIISTKCLIYQNQSIANLRSILFILSGICNRFCSLKALSKADKIRKGD